MQKLVSHAHAFVEQAARILPQIENQSLQVAHLIERIRDFMFRRLVESGDVHIADSRLDQEVQVDAVTRNLVAHHRELERLVRAFTQNRDVDSSALGTLEQVGYIASAHVVGRLAIDRGNNVARPNSRAIRRRSHKRRNHNHFVVARPDRHAHAVIFSALIFAQQGIGLGIEEIRVRIQHVQHARNGPVVDRLIGVHRFGIILLHHVIHSGELPQAVADIRIPTGSGRRIQLLPVQHPEKSAGNENENNQEKCATRTTNHHFFLRRGRRKHPSQRVLAKYNAVGPS